MGGGGVISVRFGRTKLRDQPEVRNCWQTVCAEGAAEKNGYSLRHKLKACRSVTKPAELLCTQRLEGNATSSYTN